MSREMDLVRLNKMGLLFKNIFLVIICSSTLSCKEDSNKNNNYAKADSLNVQNDNGCISHEIMVSEKGVEYLVKNYKCDSLVIECKLNHEKRMAFKSDRDLLNFEITELVPRDYNLDGFMDILIKYDLSNTAGQADLLLFNPKKNIFQVVKNFSKFPDSKLVRNGAGCYYSYRSCGCTDNCWDSDLFVFANYEIVKLGNIHHDCNAKLISVNKTRKNINVLFKQFSDKFVLNKYGDKFRFIKSLWEENSKIFTQ